MVYDAERDKRDEAVYAEHKQALALGIKRILAKTNKGELHSYESDEIGFLSGRGQAQVSTWWGMGIVFLTMLFLAVISVVLVFAPTQSGEPPMFGALFLTLFAGLFSLYSFKLSRSEYKARQIRLKRGKPQPSSRQSYDLNHLENQWKAKNPGQ